MPKKKTDAVRTPPHNSEAEESVLGSLLIDKDAMVKIADWLAPQDFYQRKHQLIYGSMIELYSAGDPTDVVTVVSRLKEKDVLGDVGGEIAVTHLATVVPTAGNVVHYARLVQKSSTRRRLISAGSDIVELGYDEAEEIDAVMDQAEQKLFSVSHSHKHHQFSPISEVLEEAFTRIDMLHKSDGGLRGVATGFRGLDAKMAGWQKSDLIILAARPSVGKTTLALDFARHAGLNGAKVGIFSLEMSKDQLVDRMLAAHAHVDLWKLRTGKLDSGGGEYDDFSRLGQAMGDLSQATIYIDDNASSNIMGMRTMARRLQSEHGLDLLIIDYLQLMESSRYTDNRVQEVSDISRNLKKLALELKVPIIALSQLSRAVEMRVDQRPKLSDLRESGSIEQDADVVMFLHRHQLDLDEGEERPETMEVDLLIEKHRNGPTGEIPLLFQSRNVTYVEMDQYHQEAEMGVPAGAAA